MTKTTRSIHHLDSAPRLPLVDLASVEPGSELEQLLSAALSHDGRPLNIFAILAHHPKLLKRFNLFGGFLLNKGLVPDRQREILILRIGSNAGSVYEFGQHTVIGAEAGLTDEEIAALASPSCLDDHPWADPDRDLIRMADELCADDCVSQLTFARLAHHWDEAQLVELVLCAGFYRMVSGFVNTMEVPLDDGVPGWP
ncbi:MAG: carboxymuconolactone decarboxylase family protein [Acidimicrobiia bacterium]|nr:carboxymuconolactone decarboxylase family protein [Acidimicrobiia bacterium]